MTPYGELSNRGKLNRLRNIATEAISRYGVHAEVLSFHCFQTNLLYKVVAKGGVCYILRLASPGWRTLDGLRGEAMWLDALACNTDIPVPRIMRTRDGEAVLPLSVPGVPDTWNTTLMSWLPGRILGNYLSSHNLEKMGILFAELHTHGKSWNRPADFPEATFEHYMSRGEPETLFDPRQTEKYAAEDLSILEEMRNRVESEYQRLDPGDLRVIHCDLWHDNIKLHKGRLLPFDFEDTVIGYRLHDIAMAMLDLLEDTDADRYPRLLDAFRRGYERLLPWPEGSMELLQIGRLLWAINWRARFNHDGLADIVRRHAAVFRNYATNGLIRFSERSNGS